MFPLTGCWAENKKRRRCELLTHTDGLFCSQFILKNQNKAEAINIGHHDVRTGQVGFLTCNLRWKTLT